MNNTIEDNECGGGSISGFNWALMLLGFPLFVLLAAALRTKRALTLEFRGFY